VEEGLPGSRHGAKAAGLTNPRVFQSTDNRNETVVLFDMKDAAAAKRYASGAEAEAGVVDQPTTFFLDEAR
jgi:hypothetical protein